MEKEIRFLNNNIQIRAIDSGNSRTVEGYAVVFNSPSEDMGFIETIHPESITQDLIDNSDVFAKLNHEDDRILARSINGNGSLKLSVDNIGLKYSFDAPNTVYGDELLEHLKRGEIFQSSFAFIVDDEGEKWTTDNNGILHRDIYIIKKLYDVSPVYQPAYSATSCTKRYLEEKEKVENLKSYYEKITDELSTL